jgi:hypothetical protein
MSSPGARDNIDFFDKGTLGIPDTACHKAWAVPTRSTFLQDTAVAGRARLGCGNSQHDESADEAHATTGTNSLVNDYAGFLTSKA